MDPGLAFAGLLVGILVGLTGVGGGSLMTPLLILFFGIHPVTAVGTDLAYGAVTKTAGGIKHLRQGTVDTRLSWWMAAGSVPAAVLGVTMLELFKSELEGSFNDVLIGAVAGAVLFAGAAILARPSLAHLVSGNIDFGLAGNLLLGSIPGIWIGSAWSARMPVPALRTALAVVLVASGVALSNKAGWEIALISFAVCAIPSATLISVFLRRRRPLPEPLPEQT
jgi:uncharacterized membrane protein YfcA